jgi:SAM-dependent methyltransferase
MIGHLAYAAPQILFDLASMVMPGHDKLTILDLGCGTGLAGAVFKPLAVQLDGVDLSPAMIEKARTRNIYDHLAVQDLTTALGAEGPSYDLILAADTLVYLGDLKPVFEAARRLAPGWLFLVHGRESEGEGFELGPKRRWRIARPICAGSRKRRVSPCRALWRRRHAMRQTARRGFRRGADAFMKRHFWAGSRVFFPQSLSDFYHMVALDNLALFGHGEVPRLKLTLGPLVAGITLIAIVLVLGAILARRFLREWLSPRQSARLALHLLCLLRGSGAGAACRIDVPFPSLFTTPDSLAAGDWGFLRQLWRLSAVGIPAQCHSPDRRSDLDGTVWRWGGAGHGACRHPAARARQGGGAPGKSPPGDTEHRNSLFLALLFHHGSGRISGPHRPDAFYDISLSLMLVGLLARYADRWFSGWPAQRCQICGTLLFQTEPLVRLARVPPDVRQSPLGSLPGLPSRVALGFERVRTCVMFC